MKVRFDNSKEWITANGCVIDIADMGTAHLMNTLRMFVQKPHLVMSMIVADIDKQFVETYYSGPWKPDNSPTLDAKALSMHNVTSLSPEELITYAVSSPLGHAMRSELTQRGVNVDNLMAMWRTEGCTDEG